MTSSATAFLSDVDFAPGRLFDTRDLDEARDRCARVLNPHSLQVVGCGQHLHSRMDHLRLGNLSLNRLSWGAAVAVDPDRLGDYYLISVPLRGRAVFHHGGHTTEVSPRQAGVISASPRFHFTASADFEQVMVRLERGAVDAGWLALAGRPPSAPINFACGLPTDGPVWLAVAPALRLLAAGAQGAYASATAHHLAARVEDLLAALLLLHQPHSMAGRPVAVERLRPVHLRRAEQRLCEELTAPWTLQSLARACGVAQRTLQTAFHDAHGMGPMQWLRRQRMDAVRHALLAQDGARPSVAQTALAFGFSHLGEFSTGYRKAFGETPSATLKRRG